MYIDCKTTEKFVANFKLVLLLVHSLIKPELMDCYTHDPNMQTQQKIIL